MSSRRSLQAEASCKTLRRSLQVASAPDPSLRPLQVETASNPSSHRVSLSDSIGSIASILPARCLAGSITDICSAFFDPEFAAALALEFAAKIFEITPGESPLSLDPIATLAADTSVRSIGILSTLQIHIDALRAKGPSQQFIESKFEMLQPDDLARLLRIHNVGSDLFTVEGWIPNAGIGFSQSSSVAQNFEVVSHKLQKFVQAGRCLVVSKEALSAEDWSKIHLNHILSVPKPGDPEGRLCLAPTNGSADHPSLNSSIDKAVHDAIFPLDVQPNAASIAEMLCGIRKANPGERIFGASADVKAAHQQVINTPRKAAVMASIIGDCVVFFLTGYFGECRAGHDYDQYRVAIDAAHNFGQPYVRSKTYADDGLLANVESRIGVDLREYIQLIIDFFGPLGYDPAKVFIWVEALVAIGFHFDLRLDVWRVAPKEASRRKIAHALLCRIPPEGLSINRDTLQSVTGLLCWYAQVIPAGRSFLYCLFNDCASGPADPSNPRNVILSPGSRADLDFWRGLAAILNFDPHFCGISIDVCRESKTPNMFGRMDASTDYGCGGFLSRTKDGPAIAACSLQWTRAELAWFNKLKVSINTLEFYAFFYCLLVWSTDKALAPLLRDAVIHVELDNTAAISYLLKNRANSKSTAHCIVRLYSLAVALFGWSLVSSHLAGILNTRSDLLSRIRDAIDFSDPLCLLRFQVDPSPQARQLEADLQKVSTTSNALSTAALCRQLLLDSITQPESMPTPTLVGRLRSVVSTAGRDSAR